MPAPSGAASGDPIASFYERYPYPPRDGREGPEDMPWISPGSLPAVAHHIFDGVLPAGRPLRMLVAGGGTGDAVLSLGGWMRRLGLAGTIDYLDLSPASCAIATRRAMAAGLESVTFRVAPLESLADGPAGIYDYVDFCGVLNHVGDPASALAALSHALAPQGGIGVMAYGRLGRTGVYEAQAALAMLGVEGARPDAVGLARSFLEGLPKSNWLSLNPGFSALATADDSEIADVLLNPRDRAFTTDELDDLVTAAGLSIRGFVPAFLYEPAAALRDPELRAAAAALDRRSQWRLAELLQGSCRKHVFYAAGHEVAARDAAVGGLLEHPGTMLIPMRIDLSEIAGRLAAPVAEGRPAGVTINVDHRQVTVGLQLTTPEVEVMAALAGPASVGEILSRVPRPAGSVVAALRSLQPKLTRIGALHVMADPARR